jgi:catechol 2,3-dioxygenase-like lactoylglutathione lyase family enzyme
MTTRFPRFLLGVVIGTAQIAFAPDIRAQRQDQAPQSSAPDAKASQTGSPAADTPISMMGVGLRVSDLERAIRFYSEGLGLKPLRRFSSTDMNEVVMGFGASAAAPQIFLLRRKDGAKDELSDAELRKDKLMLAVVDVALVSSRLKAAGYIPGPITEDSGSGAKVFWVSDPDGHRLEIISLPRR